MTRGRDRRGSAVALAVIGVLVTVGCRAGRPRPPLPTTLPGADRLVAALAAHRRALSSVRGFARISYDHGDTHVTARHAVVVALPDRFRLEALSPLGAVGVVTCDGRELALWVRRDHRTYRGAATAASVAAYTGLPLDVGDVASVLAGLPPERRMSGPAIVTADDATGLLRLQVPIEHGRETLWLTPDTLLPAASETTLDGGRVLRVDFADYRALGAVAFPRTVDVRILPDGGHIGVRWDTPTIDAPVAGDVFTWPRRPDVEEVRLDALAPGVPPFGEAEP